MSAYYVKGAYIGRKDLGKVTEKAAKSLNTIFIWFGHCVDSEVQFDCSCAGDVQRLREINPELRIVVSVGGWGAGGFSPMAATEENRRKFAKSAKRVMIDAGLDGIDIDWEYPCVPAAGIEASPDDRENFTKMLQALRDEIDTVQTPSGRHPMLTIAAGSGKYFVKNTEMDKVAKILDFVSIMTYDMRGGRTMISSHHTNLYKPENGDVDPASAENSVAVFHEAGVPLDKIVIGAAFYSRKWCGVENKNNGYLQKSTTGGDFGPEFTDLYENYINKNGYTRYWDDVAKAPYLFNGTDFISYDDEQSIAEKCKYIKEKSLLGIMYWEHGCDKTGLLLQAIDENL